MAVESLFITPFVMEKPQTMQDEHEMADMDDHGVNWLFEFSFAFALLRFADSSDGNRNLIQVSVFPPFI